MGRQHAEAAKLAHAALRAKLTPEELAAHYRRIGKKGGDATKALLGDEHYKRLGNMGGSKGGKATLAKHGHEYYVRIGGKGAAKLRELIDAGKRALAAEKPDAV